METLGLQLVGPFDILSERHKASANSQPNYHLHCRHFYDPPELQTILQGSAETQYHMGYFRLVITSIKFRFCFVGCFFPMTCDAVGLSGFTNSFVFSEILLMPFQFLLEKMRPRRAAPLHRWETISSELFCKYMPMFSLK